MADITQQEFNQMLAVAIAGGLGGGTYISRWDGEQIDDGIDKVLLPGGITATELADGAVTWPKLAVDARPTRRNLLDNAYFIGGGSQQGGGQFPINQRGQTEYAIPAGKKTYVFNRWYAVSPIAITVALQTNGVSLSQSTRLWQITEGLAPGLQYTFSVFTSDKQLYSATFSGLTSPGNDFQKAYPFGVLRAQNLSGKLGVNVQVDTGTLTLAAAKLELGPNQTQAHQDANGNWVLNDPPPDFGLELLKCQRYFQTFATQSQRPTKGADFRPVMRTENPTLGTITLPDGTVLYTASSEL